MNQVLGSTAGNALEVQEAIDFLTGTQRKPRLSDVTLALAAEMLQLGGLAPTLAAGRQLAHEALDAGRAAERFEAMVAGLGGPSTVLRRGGAKLPRARWRIPVLALEAGLLVAMDTRVIGLAIVALGGGRARPGDAIDPRVGLSELRQLGSRVQAGEPLAMLHAAQLADGKAAARSLVSAFRIGDRVPLHDVVIE